MEFNFWAIIGLAVTYVILSFYKHGKNAALAAKFFLNLAVLFFMLWENWQPMFNTINKGNFSSMSFGEVGTFLVLIFCLINMVDNIVDMSK